MTWKKEKSSWTNHFQLGWQVFSRCLYIAKIHKVTLKNTTTSLESLPPKPSPMAPTLPALSTSRVPNPGVESDRIWEGWEYRNHTFVDMPGCVTFYSLLWRNFDNTGCVGYNLVYCMRSSLVISLSEVWGGRGDIPSRNSWAVMIAVKGHPRKRQCLSSLHPWSFAQERFAMAWNDMECPYISIISFDLLTNPSTHIHFRL